MHLNEIMIGYMIMVNKSRQFEKYKDMPSMFFIDQINTEGRKGENDLRKMIPRLLNLKREI